MPPIPKTNRWAPIPALALLTPDPPAHQHPILATHQDRPELHLHRGLRPSRFRTPGPLPDPRLPRTDPSSRNPKTGVPPLIHITHRTSTNFREKAWPGNRPHHHIQPSCRRHHPLRRPDLLAPTPDQHHHHRTIRLSRLSSTGPPPHRLPHRPTLRSPTWTYHQTWQLLKSPCSASL